MILHGVGLLAVDSSRTRAYLTALSNRDLVPAHAIYLTGGPGSVVPQPLPVPYFDNSVPVLEKIKTMGIPCEVVNSSDVNSPDTIAAVQACPVDVLIYSGSGGAILGSDILGSGKGFLHLHPGIVPRFRGSTTVYYSLLLERNCGVSALFLNEQIDQGPVLTTRVYPPPEDRTTIDLGYDPYIRSDLLVQVLQEFQTTGKFQTRPQSREAGETYHIMHPVLKHLAILSKLGTNDATES